MVRRKAGRWVQHCDRCRGDALGLENGGLLGVTPAEGDVTFRSCTFRNCRLGPGVIGHKNSLVRFENISTDGCRGNCLQIIDADNCRMSEHVDNGRVVSNVCSSQAYGVELHNSPRAAVRNNSFAFPAGGGCEIRVLEPGEKIDFSRGVPAAGLRVPQ